ncbi:MAG: peptide chain release factor N(5)-glutamine methyltransferase [Puniceicoccales bacterium]|nr:peptide chain release factor N(5)-glutamine methyltransferase [Puniceicoccales bacterium]
MLEILQKTKTFFEGKGLENPRLQAELLLASALNCKRLELYLQFERPLPASVLDKLRDWVRRRAAREPLQYITGETAFRKITLKCDPRALIPRPETEELVGHVIANLPPSATRIADLGTGTGAIALSIASELPNAELVATDISSAALALATENASSLGLDQRISFIISDWLQSVQGNFDAIVANPPYLTADELATAEPEVARYEPHSALVAADNGAAALKHVLASARDHLQTGGFVALETGIAHAAVLAAHATSLGYERYEIRKDMNGRDRFFFAWK